jgi:hypothetical protein
MLSRFAVFILLSECAFSAPIFSVIPTLGPLPSSSAFAPWVSNVISGLRFNTQAGSGADTYLPMANGASLVGREFIDSTPGGFDSWQGLSPGAVLGELGTTLYFSAAIVDPASADSLNLSMLSGSEVYLGTNFGNGPVGGNYRSSLVGVDSQGNVYDNDQDPNTFVSSIFYVGFGISFPVSGIGSPQQQLDAALQAILAFPDRTTEVCYSVDGFTSPNTGCGSVLIDNQTPEPASLALVFCGLVLCGWSGFRRGNTQLD